MASFQELVLKAEKIHKVDSAESDAIDFADRAVLDAGGNLFEVILSHLLSFQWLTFFLQDLPGEDYGLRLPYLSKRFSVYGGWDGGLKNSLRYGTYYDYSSEAITYRFNAYEAPFVALHWITSHIGKALGWAIAAPFAAVGYAAKKLYYGIQKIYHTRQLQQALSKIEPIELAGEWFMNKDNSYVVDVYITKLVAQLSPKQVLDGIFSPANVNTTLQMAHSLVRSDDQNYMDYLCQPNFVYSSQSFVEVRWGYYQTDCLDYLETNRKWALAKTILSGLLLFPLFYTIPQYKKLVLENEAKQAELRFVAHGFKEKKDPRLFAGELYLAEGRVDHATQILEAIPSYGMAHAEAMSRLGHHHLAYGNRSNAVLCFTKSEEGRAQQIAEALAADSNASPDDMCSEEARSVLSSLANSKNSVFYRAQSTPVQPYAVNEVLSLDDDENLNTRLLGR